MMTLEELLAAGIVWTEDGEYLARDEDDVVCSLWMVGHKENAFRKALADGYGPQIKKA